MLEKYLTIPETAKIMGIPASTLRRAVNAGLIPSYKPFGERIRLRISEIEAVVQEAQNGGRSD